MVIYCCLSGIYFFLFSYSLTQLLLRLSGYMILLKVKLLKKWLYINISYTSQPHTWNWLRRIREEKKENHFERRSCISATIAKLWFTWEETYSENNTEIMSITRISEDNASWENRMHQHHMSLIILYVCFCGESYVCDFDYINIFSYMNVYIQVSI